jgi:DinB superfamily
MGGPSLGARGAPPTVRSELVRTFAPLREKILLSTHMSTPNSYEQFLRDFRDTIVGATARLKDIPEEQSRRQRSRDGWAPIETLGHLIDSAANNHQRFVRAQFTDDLVFPGYEQDQWITAQKYRERLWSDVIQLWTAYNLHLVHVASVIPEYVLTKSRSPHTLDQIAFKVVDKNEATTLEYLIRDYLVHLRHHLDQIFDEVEQH